MAKYEKELTMLIIIPCFFGIQCIHHRNYVYTGLIPGLRPANERRRYKVTPSLIGWAQT